jgi:hypothetical protein
LDFITSQESEIVYIDGNLAIPIHLVKNLFKSSWDLYWKSVGEKDDALISTYSKLILVFHPELYSAWNSRRSLVEKKLLDPLSEYHFTGLLLSRYPSKSTVWEYRHWITPFLLLEHSQKMELDESVCKMAADRYKCNYPCWRFRRFHVLSKCDPKMVRSWIISTLDYPRITCKYSVCQAAHLG